MNVRLRNIVSKVIFVLFNTFHESQAIRSVGKTSLLQMVLQIFFSFFFFLICKEECRVWLGYIRVLTYVLFSLPQGDFYHFTLFNIMVAWFYVLQLI